MPHTADLKKIASPELMPLIGAIGVYTYVASFIFPVEWDFPMIVLGVTATLATLVSTPKKSAAGFHRTNLILLIFLVSLGGSAFFSENTSRSISVSVTFLPALLIYFLITEQFNSKREFFLLYVCFSITAIGVSIAALYFAAANNFNIGSHLNAHAMAGSFSYIIVSRNDLTFLSILVPFSYILAYQKPLSPVGMLAIISIVLSLFTITVFQSRGATLTFLMTFGAVAFLLEHRKALWLSLIALALFLGIDGMLDFSLLKRFYGIASGVDEITGGRSTLWWIVLNHFKEAPILGHGPHTFALYSKIPWPHNLYLEVLFNQGVIGFLSFTALLGYNLIKAWNLRLAAHKETRFFAMGALAALIGFSFSSIIELTFLRLWVTVTLFLILGIIVRLSATKNTI